MHRQHQNYKKKGGGTQMKKTEPRTREKPGKKGNPDGADCERSPT